MKNTALYKRIAIYLVVALTVLAGIVCVVGPVDSFAEDEYTYTVRIYAGNQGTIDGGDVKVYTNLKAGDRVKFDPESVALKDNKYYVSGIRKSGADNYDPNNPQTSVITVKGDEDYVVAYGIRGKSVQYTVRYLDEGGRSLADPKSFYGNIGDKPMVAFEYIEGYYPRAYNLTKTLTSDASQNVFDFIYLANPVNETVITQTQDGVTTGTGAAGAGGAGAGGTGAGEGAAIADNETPQGGPQDVVDLDDNKTPTTDTAGVEDNKFSGTAVALIGGALVVAAAAAAAFVLFARRRRNEEE